MSDRVPAGSIKDYIKNMGFKNVLYVLVTKADICFEKHSNDQITLNLDHVKKHWEKIMNIIIECAKKSTKPNDEKKIDEKKINNFETLINIVKSITLIELNDLTIRNDIKFVNSLLNLKPNAQRSCISSSSEKVKMLVEIAGKITIDEMLFDPSKEKDLKILKDVVQKLCNY